MADLLVAYGIYSAALIALGVILLAVLEGAKGEKWK